MDHVEIDADLPWLHIAEFVARAAIARAVRGEGYPSRK
jgi:hypothetical protein